MEPKDFAAIVAHLKGAPISALMILFSLRRPVDERTLSLLSGYCLRSVKEGLQNLCLLGLVEYIEEIGGWRPSQHAMDILHKLSGIEDTSSEGGSEEQPVEGNESLQVEKNFFVPSSSRRLILSPNIKINKKPLQPPPKAPPNKRIKPEKQGPDLPNDPNIHQAYLLLVRTGIPNFMAADAIAEVVKAGWEGEKVINAVKGWLAYAASDEGVSIKQPGFLIASRLKDLQEPPELDKGVGKEERDPKRYTKGKYGHLIQH